MADYLIGWWWKIGVTLIYRSTRSLEQEQMICCEHRLPQIPGDEVNQGSDAPRFKQLMDTPERVELQGAEE